MPQKLDDALAYSKRWMDIIEMSDVPEQLGKQIIDESKSNFAEYFNKGWLDYRKSVTEAGDWAATEWTGMERYSKTCLVANTSIAWAAMA